MPGQRQRVAEYPGQERRDRRAEPPRSPTRPRRPGRAAGRSRCARRSESASAYRPARITPMATPTSVPASRTKPRRAAFSATHGQTEAERHIQPVPAGRLDGQAREQRQARDDGQRQRRTRTIQHPWTLHWRNDRRSGRSRPRAAPARSEPACQIRPGSFGVQSDVTSSPSSPPTPTDPQGASPPERPPAPRRRHQAAPRPRCRPTSGGSAPPGRSSGRSSA